MSTDIGHDHIGGATLVTQRSGFPRLETPMIMRKP